MPNFLLHWLITACTNAKPPYLIPSGDGSVGNERKQGIALCTCNLKKPRG